MKFIIRGMQRRLWASSALAVLLFSNSCWAILVPAGGVGSGVGWIEHAFGPVGGLVAPGGLPADFNGFYSPNLPFGDPAGLGTSGGMRAPGFNYPAFPVIPWPAVFQNDTGNFPMLANVPNSLITPANISGFGGAATSMVGVGGGGRAGVSANFSLKDASPKDAFRASTNTFASAVVYNSVGVTITRFGHFLGATANVPVGGYAAAGVKSIFEIGTHNPVTGAFAVDAFWEPLPIIVAFDGAAGPLADVIQAQFFNFNTLGQSLSFATLSTTPFAVIPAGKSVRMRSTVTLVADPDAELDMIPISSFFDVFTELDSGALLGFGASTDANNLLTPEPTSAVILLPAFALIGRARRRRS